MLPQALHGLCGVGGSDDAETRPLEALLLQGSDSRVVFHNEDGLLLPFAHGYLTTACLRGAP